MDNRKGNSQPFGFGHFFDTIGVKIGAVKALSILGAGFSAQDIVDDPDQFVIAFIKKKPGNVIIVHKVTRTCFLKSGLLKSKQMALLTPDYFV